MTVSATLHDGVGRPVKTTNAQGHVTLTSYTADGLVKSVQAPSAPGLTHETEYAYDENGNRTKEVTPRQSAGDRPYTETTYYADNRVRAIYAGGNDVVPAVRGDIVTSYDYDANGNPTAVTSPSANAKDANNLHGEPTRNQYTPDNLLLTTTQPVVVNATGVVQSRVTTYAYDAAGRKTSVDVDLTGTPAVDGAPQTFTYFPTGLVETETGRGGGDTVARGYDATGALVSAVDSDGATSRTTTAGYYLDGLPRQVVSDGRVTAYAYDGSGARAALGEGVSGQPLSVTRYTVNDAGLPVSMTSADSGTIGWAYNSLGQLVTETRGDRTQVWAYRADDLLGRTAVASTPSLAEQVRDGTAAADLASYSYEYDELGRQTEQSFYGRAATSPLGDVASGAPVAYTYAYDRAGRLSSFTDARGTRTLTFDHNGNRTAYGTGVEPGATSFTYRADDSIATSATGLTTRTYQYADAFGGVTHDGCAAYGYDGLDRLTLVDAPASPPAGCPAGDVAYRYDGLDRQVRRTADGTTVSLHYDGLGQTTLLQAGAPDGTLHHTISPSGTVLTARRGTGATEHLADDGTGSTGLVTAADSTVLCTARYDAYGSPDGNTAVEPTGSCNTGTAQNDVFYRGNRKDTTTGQYQLGSRTYDPAKAGFLTPDTYRTGDPAQNLGIGTDPLTRNTYAYVNGDPINYTDPSGHEPRPVGEQWSGNGCTSGGCSKRPGRRRGPIIGDVRVSEDPCWVRFTCTSRDFDAMTPEGRRGFIAYVHSTHAGRFRAERWFNAIDAVLAFAAERAAESDDLGRNPAGWQKDGSWFSIIDAEILGAIHDGFALALDLTLAVRGEGQVENLYETRNPGARLWRDFLLHRQRNPRDYDGSVRHWARAEQAATDYGVAMAAAMGVAPDRVQHRWFGLTQEYRKTLLERPPWVRDRIINNLGPDFDVTDYQDSYDGVNRAWALAVGMEGSERNMEPGGILDWILRGM